MIAGAPLMALLGRRRLARQTPSAPPSARCWAVRAIDGGLGYRSPVRVSALLITAALAGLAVAGRGEREGQPV
ncbi:hypothetical protein [Streptomyces sp. CoH27]|uniref:hypothetical protein n=1 Tax=Streptomyces sp. CoH27 TaxID=2875763 RepID=UPI001CD4915D|nr:hypothetical protein [Streptomyces sp. CoH27]